ncbi:hypothetical protein EDEG_02608 [Edhazardia aedis USNM 41457]|uniref:Uncharacterized protein n=1 Tax=Edhazardia aedis (strain USNM 41457) TaxID=1003232 RepID=J9D5F6_EDHAE|nr:hypothetical protein EDEG_02608 [Edhazardia aedis USNM 41457]|eukprot:EJW03026.1 hypothetical protein EDEG_02608 [Edhazardia aedis USNM 41457]
MNPMTKSFLQIIQFRMKCIKCWKVSKMKIIFSFLILNYLNNCFVICTTDENQKTESIFDKTRNYEANYETFIMAQTTKLPDYFYEMLFEDNALRKNIDKFPRNNRNIHNTVEQINKSKNKMTLKKKVVRNSLIQSNPNKYIEKKDDQNFSMIPIKNILFIVFLKDTLEDDQLNFCDKSNVLDVVNYLSTEKGQEEFNNMYKKSSNNRNFDENTEINFDYILNKKKQNYCLSWL